MLERKQIVKFHDIMRLLDHSVTLGSAMSRFFCEVLGLFGTVSRTNVRC